MRTVTRKKGTNMIKSMFSGKHCFVLHGGSAVSYKMNYSDIN